MPDPHRNVVEDIVYTRSEPDPIEQEAALAIRLLRDHLAAWCRSNPYADGSSVASAQVGHGTGVAKIIDAVNHLRAQKIGA